MPFSSRGRVHERSDSRGFRRRCLTSLTGLETKKYVSVILRRMNMMVCLLKRLTSFSTDCGYGKQLQHDPGVVLLEQHIILTSTVMV